MRPLIQKLPLAQEHSFVARTYRTPSFEVGWHQHVEYELILFTEGHGMSFVGNHVGTFETGDIYLLGSNLPHTFQKQSPDLICSAVVVQFLDDFWGKPFLQLPESAPIRYLLDTAASGFKIQPSLRIVLGPLIRKLEYATAFERVLLLASCLHQIEVSKEHASLSTQAVRQYNSKDAATIDRIFQFTIDRFKNPISLDEIAAVACMSVSNFCAYFKKSTQKTYVDFLNEVRIGYSCSLLSETNRTVLDICFESGYNTLANFHKQFLRLRQVTPLQYRKQFKSKAIAPQNNIGIIPEV